MCPGAGLIIAFKKNKIKNLRTLAAWVAQWVKWQMWHKHGVNRTVAHPQGGGCSAIKREKPIVQQPDGPPGKDIEGEKSQF